jgi:hypothetical protein
MKPRTFVIAILLAALLVSCAPATEKQAAEVAAEPTRTPFLMAGELFLNAPQDFLLDAEIAGDYAAADAGTQSPNSRLLELRPDGQAYIEATGRLDGWQRQLNRDAGSGPLYIVNVVNIYETAEGPHVVLSPEWHADVWARIESGELTRLADIAGLDTEHLVWQDATGTVGVEIAYRNLYILLTGPTDGGDQYEFFANLAREYLEWIKAGE